MNDTGYDVLVGCEYSGRVREAFRSRGINALSVDLLPSEDESPHHIQDDVRFYLSKPWLAAIFHPPCTYLANSGVRWRVERREWREIALAAAFFVQCLRANAPMVAIENPVMHRYGRDQIGRGPDFTVQPWQFGDPYRKRTCFWTRGLPVLRPTSTMTADGAEAECHKAPPSPDRWKNRSRTYPGIASAIADQWGGLIQEAVA